MAKRVMISSTSLDLPEYREQIKEACLRMGLFLPDMMEHGTATDADALKFSLDMVDKADLYIGIFAFRYGYVPEGQTISVTEAEYNRAGERGIPRLIFLMDEEHPVKASDFETGEGAEKLKKLKDRLKKDLVVGFFTTPDRLRALVVQALVPYQDADTTKFHYVSEIPTPPEIYVAHPYTLLQTHGLVGRQPELNLLTEWVARPDSDIYNAHILSIVAIGGMGKSALTWKWFEDIALEEMKPLAGRLWWSFYESDASFENFIIRALAYVSKRSIEDVQQINPQDRESQLLAILDRDPYLLVLDGLERILIAYARMDAAYLSDSDYDKQTANYVVNAYGLPPGAAQSFTGQHLLRKTADPRAGAFLRKLSRIRAARILVSTRLYPFDLQRTDALPLPGCDAVFLSGLSNDDALNLWRSFGVSGSHDQLVPIFKSFENHALLIQALAGEIANYRPAPGNFEKWREANPDFNPANYPYLHDAMAYVLEYALRGLGDVKRSVLQTISGFRMPTHYDTLSAILIGKEKVCKDARELDAALAELEDRGLVGWDKRANRYDLHPIVRGVVWSGLSDNARQGVYTRLNAYFKALAVISENKVGSVDDLTPALELYNTLIKLEHFYDAWRIFRSQLNRPTRNRLCANGLRVELLTELIPQNSNAKSPLQGETLADALNNLAISYDGIGRLDQAAKFFQKSNKIYLGAKNKARDINLAKGLRDLASTLRNMGCLFQAEVQICKALILVRELEDYSSELYQLLSIGKMFVTRGNLDDSNISVKRALRILSKNSNKRLKVGITCLRSLIALHSEEYDSAIELADMAQNLASGMGHNFLELSTARSEGRALLELGDLDSAYKPLSFVLKNARDGKVVKEELSALIALAELRRRQGDEKSAREFLDDVWEFAERGPYPLLHADALNVLAQIERDAGNTVKAIEAGTKAYQLSWCDGPPYAYHWGLIKAQKHLEELGAPLPDMPPFDESKFEPMPDVEIDPDDEFHVGKE